MAASLDTAEEGVSEELAAACAGRRRRLALALQEHRLDALVVSAPVDIRYLSGFEGDDSLLLLHGDVAAIISDPRFDEHLEPWRSLPGLSVVMGVRHRLEDSVAACAPRSAVRRVGVQAERMTLAGRTRLAEALGAERVVETNGLLGTLRRSKDALEVAAIERAIGVQEAACRAALDQLEVGATECELAALIEYEMRRRGATGASFGTIVGAGANSSIIHHRAAGARIERGTLLVDWGAQVDGYCGDITRTFGVGEMPATIRELYSIVLDAQREAIAACRPGRSCASVDAVARRVITGAGYGDRFAHGLGHGIGLEIHEGPYFNDLETETLLVPGMVMTIEPGIYVPGVGGVRIEDDVLITDGGCRVLTSWPKGLDHAIVEPGPGGGMGGGSGGGGWTTS